MSAGPCGSANGTLLRGKYQVKRGGRIKRGPTTALPSLSSDGSGPVAEPD